MARGILITPTFEGRMAVKNHTMYVNNPYVLQVVSELIDDFR